MGLMTDHRTAHHQSSYNVAGFGLFRQPFQAFRHKGAKLERLKGFNQSLTGSCSAFGSR
ncbi:hypothetical protein EMIT0215P_60009 [Pseudomonas serboccidentalis]